MPAGRLGVMIDRDLPPESLVETVVRLEALGVDEIWVVEDLGWGGGVSAAATVLASTDRVRVGIGIMPAPLRNPALMAMEIATLARLHPGRFVAGIGHGVQDWMRRAGAAAPSPLALLEETFVTVRALLEGRRVEHRGAAVTVDGVELVHPPTEAVHLLAGVTGPRSLDLAGRIADGVILIEGSGAPQIEAALAPAAGRAYETVVFCHLFVSDDAAAVEEAVATVARDFFETSERDFTMAAGTAAEAADVVRGLWAAGATGVVLRPVGDHVAAAAALLAALEPRS